MRRRLVVLSLIIGIAGVAFVIYRRSYQTLIITFNDSHSGVVVDVYKYTSDNDTNTVKPADLVGSNISLNTSLKLRRGGYRIVSKKNTSYRQIDEQINLADSVQSVVIDPAYSVSKLTAQLQNEQQAINKSLMNTFPNLQRLYTVGRQELFNKGEWYGATLDYKGFDYQNNDRLLVVAQKTKGAWVVITQPPEQTISNKKYPQIPRDIVIAMNRNIF
jgi:uncharacterized pyridoxamine 5'-phosphate oxidase family protein